MKEGLWLLLSIIAVIIYFGLHYYIGKRFTDWVKVFFPSFSSFVIAIPLALLGVTTLIGFMPLTGTMKFVTNDIGSYWLGIFVYFLLFFFVADLLLIVLKLFGIVATPFSKKIRFYHGLIVLLTTALISSYGFYHATHIERAAYSVTLPKAKEPLRIVLLTDLHIGATGSEERLGKIVAQTNHEKPDLILIAGDIFDDQYEAIRQPERAVETLKKFEARYGVYASLGNHDAGESLSQMLDFLAQSKIDVLLEQAIIINDKWNIVGRLDPSPIGGYGDMTRGKVAPLFETVDEHLPTIVLDHTPTHLDDYDGKADVILSGHTHKGQIFPANFVTKQIFDVDYGAYQKSPSSPNVIVSSGAGTWGMPMRVGSDCEIVVLDIQ